MFFKAHEIVKGISEGSLTAISVLEKCFENIDMDDNEIRAWVCLDRDGASDRANMLDKMRKSGKAIGPLTVFLLVLRT